MALHVTSDAPSPEELHHYRGRDSTQIPLGPETGLTKYDVSYANVTGIHTLAQTKLSRRRGSLHPGALVRIEDALRVTLGL